MSHSLSSAPSGAGGGSSSALANRVHDIIRRMNDNLNQSEATKTCYGILAIMSREESSKVIIVKSGLEIILNGMQIHLDKGDVQEAGCDLIWSLAFNNSLVKEIIGNINGTSILVRGLKRHYKSPEYLKSACGALSNLCQFKLNQQNFASQGGLQPLLHSIPYHQTNLKLLPFIFDALASLIVGNEENARIVTSQDGILKILTVLSQHKDSVSSPEIVKSGCHTLAILSDIKGHASKIAQAGGVMIILPLLDLHAAYSDLHRVAAVVLLRMLQESSQVIRDIIANEGVRILLKSLEKGGAQQDTVAALTHILATVTNPLTTASLTSIESQLWISPSSQGTGVAMTSGRNSSGEPQSDKRSARFGRPDARTMNPSQGAENLHLGNPRKAPNPSTSQNHPPAETTTALGGLVRLMGQYSDRKDVSRASCRLLSHIIGTYPGVGMALDKLLILDRIMECLDHHSQTKDILESACTILKSLHKRSPLLSFNGHKLSSIKGLLFLLRVKCGTDEEIVTASTELLTRLIAAEIQRPSTTHSSAPTPLIQIKGLKGAPSPAIATPTVPQVVEWGQDSLSICSIVFENLAIGMRNGASVERLQTPSPPQDRRGSNPSVMPPVVSNSAGTPGRVGTAPVSGGGVSLPGMVWSKTTPKLLTTLLDHLDLLLPLLFRSRESSSSQSLVIPEMLIPSVQAVHSSLPARYSQEFSARMTQLLATLQQILLSPPDLESTSLPPSRLASANGSQKPAISKSGLLDDAGKEWDGSGGSAVRGGSSTSERTKCLLDRNSSKKSLDSLEEGTMPPDHQQPLIQTYPPYLEPLAYDSGLTSFSICYTGCRMQLCYENNSFPGGKNIQSRCAIPVPYSVPPGGMGLPFHHSIQFSSEFESGNLYRAIQRDEREYDLCLRPDLHTPGHTQWFYFSVSNLFPERSSSLPAAVTALPLRIKFNIINLTKPDSLFNQGMKPVVYGLNAARTKDIGWVRSGSNISYFSNPYPRGNSATAGEGNDNYYTLTFTLEFSDVTDTYHIAYYYPYTYSDHKAHLQNLLVTNHALHKDRLRAVKLCTTLGGYDCDLLIVTNFKENKETIGPIYTPPQTTLNPSATATPAASSSSSSSTPFYSTSSGGAGTVGGAGNGVSKGKSRGATSASGGGAYSSCYRKGIVVSARVHPGEPPASFMMKGFIDFIVSSHPIATLLRSLYVFYLIPILNPDGVIFGNNRCNLSGVDLNRQWKTPLKSLHPTIYALKSLLQDQRSYRDMYMYLDLHGHSRKYNIFLYGVDDGPSSSGGGGSTGGNVPNPNYTTGSTLSLSTLLPSLLSQQQPSKKSSAAKSYSKIRSFAKFFSLHSMGHHYVSYSDCSFHIRKGRESTARVIVAKEIGIPLSFTVEATFCGVNYGSIQSHHMNIGHYLEVGTALCDVILQYGVAEGDIPETVWVNYLRALGGKGGGGKDGADLVLRSQMIRDHLSDVDEEKEEEKLRIETGRRRGSLSSASEQPQHPLSSRRCSLKSEAGREIQDTKGEEQQVDGEEGETKEGEDDSDADGEDDDDAPPSERPVEGREDPSDNHASQSISPSPIQEVVVRSVLQGSQSLDPSTASLPPSSRRLIHTAGGSSPTATSASGTETFHSSSCSTGRSETAPSSTSLMTQLPMSYPGYAHSLSSTAAPSSSCDYSSVGLSPSPSSGAVKRIARDDGFTFSESVLANRMIAGLNTAQNSGATGTSLLLSSTNPVAISAVGKSGGSVPLISSVNEGNRSKGTSSSNSSTTGASAVSMRPKKVSRKGGLKAKKAKRKARPDSMFQDEESPNETAYVVEQQQHVPKLSLQQISLDDSPFSQQQSTSGSHCGLPKVK